MAAVGQIPDEDCVDDRRVAEFLVELIEVSDVVVLTRVETVDKVCVMDHQNGHHKESVEC